MQQRFFDRCTDCEHRTDDCGHALRDDLVVYFSRNPGADCPCR